MRHAVVFALALGLGALSVTGQDAPDKNRELKERIEQLAEELEQRAARRAAPEEMRLVLKTYDVSDLCSPVHDYYLAPSNLQPSQWEASEPREAREEAAPYAVDQIIELIRVTVMPESWDSIEGADIQPKNFGVFVNTIPAVHERIAKLLEYLHSFLDVQIAVDVVAVPASASELAAYPRELPDDVARELLARAPLGAARVVCFDGQQVVHRAGREQSYVADYRVEIAQDAAMGDPVRAEIFVGCAVEVRGMLDRGANAAVLHLLLDRTSLAEPLRRIRTVHGTLDLPVMEVTRVGTALWAPLDRTVVAAAGTLGDESCAWLVTARRVSAAGG